MLMRLLLNKSLAFMLTLLCAGTVLSGWASADISTTLAELREEHQHAIHLSHNYPARGRQAHIEVARKMEALWQNDVLNQGALAYNIGNSWFHAGRFGESILWYRRAQEQGFDDERLTHNLSQARSKKLDSLPSSFGPSWLMNVHSWSGSSFWLMFAAVVYLLFWRQLWWFLCTGQIEKGRMLLVSLAMLVTAVVSLVHFSYDPVHSDGVITALDTTARKGPGLIFAPAFTTPLNQGTEFVLLQKQNNWQEVLLGNGSRVWLHTNSTTLIAES